MKRGLTASLLTVITIAFAVFSSYTVSAQAEKTIALSELTYRDASHFDELGEQWEKSRKILSLFVRKEYISPVDLLISRAEYMSEAALRDACGLICVYMEEIRKSAALSPGNIL